MRTCAIVSHGSATGPWAWSGTPLAAELSSTGVDDVRINADLPKGGGRVVWAHARRASGQRAIGIDSALLTAAREIRLTRSPRALSPDAVIARAYELIGGAGYTVVPGDSAAPSDAIDRIPRPDVATACGALAVREAPDHTWGKVATRLVEAFNSAWSPMAPSTLRAPH